MYRKHFAFTDYPFHNELEPQALFPGAATAMGFVPSMAFLAKVGTTRTSALVIDIPMQSCSSAIMA